ncbi:MAG: outer membrane beta-barrel protein [Saprospirales bacterium]|jgi:OOP family OmpA-OmpF porin|nr:outer membrane beta-barrel protein [Saprospirales bacterium]MBK8920600.1 outer membrane beta-barrel protein [Saprospirales bacterium]
MRQNLLLFLFLLSISLQAQRSAAPHYLEAGGMLGVASYSGDIAAKGIDLQELRPGFGAFIRYHLTGHLAIKGHLYAGTISGDDKYSEVKGPRSFKFGTSLIEVAGLLEWHLFRRDGAGSMGERRFMVNPYLFAGVGITFADADAQYYGPVDRREQFLVAPLPEEGLKNRFVLVPLGGGVRIDFFERFIFGLEGGFRPVFSDAIDGVSQNGNPRRNDWYYFFGATASFVLNGPDI